MMYLYTPGFVNEVDGNVIDTSFCAYFLPVVGFDGSASVGIPGIVFAVSAFVNFTDFCAYAFKNFYVCSSRSYRVTSFYLVVKCDAGNVGVRINHEVFIDIYSFF